jgi:DNA-binding MarR family transcriptional regulator
MMESQERSREELIQCSIEKFWQTLPGIWHNVRAHTREVVTDGSQISMPQFAILRSISFGKNSVSQLAVEGRISRPAISRQVDVLVRFGLVARDEDPVDRRHVKLTLTKEGDQLVKSVFADTSRWMISRINSLNEKELSIVIQSLDLLRLVFLG